MRSLFNLGRAPYQLSPIAHHNFLHLKGYYFCRALIFGYVIERLYWASKGISVGDTVLLEFIYALILTLTEIPSGIWADRFGRKQLILASAILAFFSNSLLLFSGFAAFALSVSISGIYGAFSSGAVNALLYDSLKENCEEALFPSCLAALKKWRLIGYVIAALLGSFMAARFSMTLNYQLSLMSCAAAIFFAYRLQEPSLTQSREVAKSHWSSTYLQATLNLFRNRQVLPALIGGLMTGAGIIYIDEFWQNYCQLIPMPILYFGAVSLTFGGFQALFSQFLERFGESPHLKRLTQQGLGSFCLLFGGLFVALGQTPSWWGLLLMTAAFAISTSSEIQGISGLHQSTESEVRAGVESVYSMLLRVTSIGFGLIFGISDKLLVTEGYERLGMCLILLSLFLIALQLWNYTHREVQCVEQNGKRKTAMKGK